MMSKELNAEDLLDALENIVNGLNETYWSSWQTTAHFREHLEKAEELISTIKNQ